MGSPNYAPLLGNKRCHLNSARGLSFRERGSTTYMYIVRASTRRQLYLNAHRSVPATHDKRVLLVLPLVLVRLAKKESKLTVALRPVISLLSL